MITGQSLRYRSKIPEREPLRSQERGKFAGQQPGAAAHFEKIAGLFACKTLTCNACQTARHATLHFGFAVVAADRAHKALCHK